MPDKPVARNISCHSWNADGTQLAVSPNSNEIWIFSTDGQEDASQWDKVAVLKQHDSFVSGIDWCHETNLIVSCGHDRNAYVWKNDGGEWKPELVILRINRAANGVKWSPNGQKFAVTSSAKQVPVCHYEEGNKWWVSKMIKKHKSTVLSLDWHPNNRFLVTGGCDFKCRVFSSFIPDVDTTDDEASFAAHFPEQFKFGAVLAEFDMAKGWIEAVAWQPSGWGLSFAGHDSSLHFVDITNATDKQKPVVQSITYDKLPFRDIGFLNDQALIAVGHDCQPILFVHDGEQWVFEKALDESKKKAATGGPKKASAFGSAMAMFGNQADKGVSIGKTGGVAVLTNTNLTTRHQNQITQLRIRDPGTFTTSGVDGRVLFWHLNDLEVDLSRLTICVD